MLYAIEFPSDVATVGVIEIQNLVKVCSLLHSYGSRYVSDKHSTLSSQCRLENCPKKQLWPMLKSVALSQPRMSTWSV